MGALMIRALPFGFKSGLPDGWKLSDCFEALQVIQVAQKTTAGAADTLKTLEE